MQVVAGTLYVCAVPIGNLGDASPRLREVLAGVDAIACEDTRTTGRLLELLEVRPKPRLLAHHEHNERASADGIVALLRDGVSVAVVSDAGTPAVSDPGAALVDAVLEAGLPVQAVAGPSAVAAAVSVAGMTGAQYRFVGFLPRTEAELQSLVRTHAHEMLVAFESPNRIARSVARIADAQPDRRIAVCRELTKLHEQVLRGPAVQVAEQIAEEPVRGEVVLVLDALDVVASPDAAPGAVALAVELVGEGLRARAAARIAAEHLGGSSRAIYDALHALD